MTKVISAFRCHRETHETGWPEEEVGHLRLNDGLSEIAPESELQLITVACRSYWERNPFTVCGGIRERLAPHVSPCSLHHLENGIVFRSHGY